MGRLLSALAALAVIGCGGRSDLVAASGSVGGETECNALAVTGDDTLVPRTIGFGERRPALVSLGAADPPAVVVLGLDPLGAQSPLRSHVGVLGVDPWGAWPPALAAPTSMVTTGFQEPFAIASSMDGVFSIAVDERPPDDEETGGLASATDATAGGAASFIVDHTVSAAPAFIVHTEFHPIVAYQEGKPGAPGDLVLEAINDVTVISCGAAPVPAAAVDAGELVLVATVANGCGEPPVPDTAATRIQIIAVDAVTPVTTHSTLMDEMVAEGPILAIALVPRSDGAWLLYKTGGQDKTNGPVLGVMLDPLGFVRYREPIELTPVGRGAFAAAPFGDGLALITLADGAPSPLEARLVDASGALVAGPVSIAAAPGAIPTAPLAILAAPSSRAWLVAWSGLPKADIEAQIHLARVGCAGR